ncbi:MAG: chemotaxis protein CheA [Planctomycetaceae bacterium]
MEGFDEVIKEFLVESYESLDQLDRDLVALEDAPDDRDRLASIFRTVHTIKGTSGFLALPKLERVAHVGENLLVPLRDGELRLTAEIADGLLGMVDAIREILSHIEAEGAEGDTDFAPLTAKLESLLKSGTAAEAEPPQTATATLTEPEADDTGSLTDAEVLDVVNELAAPKSTSKAAPKKRASRRKATAKKTSPAKKSAGNKSKAAEATDEPELATATAAESAPAEEATPAAARTPARKPVSASVESAAPSSGESNGRQSSVADSTIRIDVELLDRLMNLVGELVLARNQILQFSQLTDDPALSSASQRVNLITTELQEGVMKTRMQPIRNAWSKLPRVVRDLSHACGKNVQVKMEGADTELDKTILEAIKDPLTHIVRNSVDHGIESPADRAAAGKPEEGTLLLRAYHEGGQVNIEIIDDGGGINVDRVRAKAVDKGLISEEQAEAMGDREAVQLILLPGFSTAAKVTNVSGRGVGMDVVKTNVEQIGGSLDIQSKSGHGTTLRIKIPLTLAIVPALIVRTGGDQYAIPQVSLLELVRLDGARAAQEIEFIHDVPVYRLRGDLLPLVYLDEQLGLTKHAGREHTADETVNIVVLQAEHRQFGLVVDSITDTQEIVVKPLGQHLKGIAAYAGSTIMGDGSVALILDVIGLARIGNVLSEHHDQALKGANEKARSEAAGSQQSLLVVDPGNGTRVAVRLSMVARLEEFAPSDIEQSGGSEVVQYRGRIMPLLRLSGGGFGATSAEDTGRVPVVVYTTGLHSVGIVVGRIIDIVEQTLDDSLSKASSGQLVVQGRVTELVNLESLVRRTFPDFFEQDAVA